MNNEAKVEKFLKIQTKREVASFLGIKYNQLFYRVHKVKPEKNYVSFEIKKKSGKKRQIVSPTSTIKYAQRGLNEILQLVYRPRKSVHGFIKKRSVVTNAKNHTRKRYVFNVDLDNFFPSIHLGRVIGVFKSYPFAFNTEVATFLAQICCYNASLPQGAPTSLLV